LPGRRQAASGDLGFGGKSSRRFLADFKLPEGTRPHQDRLSRRDSFILNGLWTACFVTAHSALRWCEPKSGQAKSRPGLECRVALQPGEGGTLLPREACAGPLDSGPNIAVAPAPDACFRREPAGPNDAGAHLHVGLTGEVTELLSIPTILCDEGSSQYREDLRPAGRRSVGPWVRRGAWAASPQRHASEDDRPRVR
jgi:hypothetical protein